MSEDIRVKDGIMNHLNRTWADTEENKMKQDLIIIGYGHVGKAIDKTLNPIHRIVAIDIDGYQKNTITKHEGYSAKGIIICVPTPEAEDGSCDISIVEKVLQESNKLNLPVLNSRLVFGASVNHSCILNSFNSSLIKSFL